MAEHPKMTVRELADLVGVSQPNMYGLTRKLQAEKSLFVRAAG